MISCSISDDKFGRRASETAASLGDELGSQPPDTLVEIFSQCFLLHRELGFDSTPFVHD